MASDLIPTQFTVTHTLSPTAMFFLAALVLVHALNLRKK